ncbi:MAG: hypothetical protein J0H69_24350 [Burkholderiales bacterium]|nr:hypothetical protein [Burkholderiales bacterium]
MAAAHVPRESLAVSFLRRIAFKTACAVLLPACLLGAVAVHLMPAPAGATPRLLSATEWPLEWDGAPLRPLALGEVERRFAAQFPGALARLTDGHQVLVMRQVSQPTRMLHPATDCYRGLGYRITAKQLERRTLDGHEGLWRCFEATKGGVRQRVCERIVDAQGQTFTDTSAWYWAAIAGRSRGPWQAVTVATPLASQATTVASATDAAGATR